MAHSLVPPFDEIATHLEHASRHEGQKVYYTARCPFHDDNRPSLMLFPDGFVCMSASCRRRGRLSALWAHVQGWPAHEISETQTASGYPTDPANFEQFALDAHASLIAQPHLLGYLDQRGVSSLIQTKLFGFLNGDYIFPVRDAGGAVTGLLGHPRRRSSHLKYITVGGPRLFVGDHELADQCPYLLVPFGVFDMWCLTALGFPTATSTTGWTYDPAWFDSYRKPIIIIPDAGELPAARRIADALGWRGEVLQLKFPPKIKDPNDYVQLGKTQTLIRELEAYLHGKHKLPISRRSLGDRRRTGAGRSAGPVQPRSKRSA